MVDVEDRLEKQKEEAFNNWLESISFVDADGRSLPVVLEDDDSDDPENDRAEEE